MRSRVSRKSSIITVICVFDLRFGLWHPFHQACLVIVASLPGLKHFIVRGGTPSNTYYNHGTHGYVQEGPGHPVSTSGTSRTRIKGRKSEDELELVFLDRESLAGSIGEGAKDGQNVVMVTKDITVTKM